MKDAEVFVVGRDSWGELGLGNGQYNKVVLLSKIKLPLIRSLANSFRVSSAVDASGRLWSWGDNYSGQLGRATQGSTDGTPRIVESLNKFKIKQVACGDLHVCCVTTDGEVFTWGSKEFIGQGHLDSDVKMPTKLNIEKVSQISCGERHTLLLSADQKTVRAFGDNGFGQLGLGPELLIAAIPVKVPFSGDKIIVDLQCYGCDSALLSADGEIRVWGQTWNGGNIGSTRLVNIGQTVDISLGWGFMLVLTAENRLYAFGKNHSGQCGQGYTSDFIPEPVEVKNLQDVRIKQISAGGNHCLIKCTKN